MTNVENNQSEKHEREAYLYKWLMRMFWWFIPVTIFGVFSSFISENDFPVLYYISIAGLYLSYVPAILIFFKLSKKEKTFLPAGICYLIITIGAAIGYTFTILGLSVLASGIFVLNFIGAQVANYFETRAYGKSLAGIDDRLSRTWKLMWWASLGCNLLEVGCSLLVLVSETAYQAGFVVVRLLNSLILIFIQIMMYKTAMVFNRIVLEEEESLLR